MNRLAFLLLIAAFFVASCGSVEKKKSDNDAVVTTLTDDQQAVTDMVAADAEEETADTDVVSTIDPDNVEVNTEAVTEEIPVETAVVVPEEKYFIIAGSFAVLAEAQKLNNQLLKEGYPSIVLAKANGYSRVSINTYTDENLARTEKETLQKKFKDLELWLLKQ